MAVVFSDCRLAVGMRRVSITDTSCCRCKGQLNASLSHRAGAKRQHITVLKRGDIPARQFILSNNSAQ